MTCDGTHPRSLRRTETASSLAAAPRSLPTTGRTRTRTWSSSASGATPFTARTKLSGIIRAMRGFGSGRAIDGRGSRSDNDSWVSIPDASPADAPVQQRSERDPVRAERSFLRLYKPSTNQIIGRKIDVGEPASNGRRAPPSSCRSTSIGVARVVGGGGTGRQDAARPRSTAPRSGPTTSVHVRFASRAASAPAGRRHRGRRLLPDGNVLLVGGASVG